MMKFTPAAVANRGRIIALLLMTVSLIGCSDPEPPRYLNATMLPQAKPLAGFELTDQDGKAFTNSSLEGHWTFMFFGYTHCPDVCPNSLSLLGSVYRGLEQQLAEKDRPAVVFVSVDPERDTPDLLRQFVPYFHESFTGVTGDKEQIHRLARPLGILYMKADTDETGGYLVDHSAAIILINPQGQFQAVFSMPHDVDSIQSDFLAIKNYYEATQ